MYSSLPTPCPSVADGSSRVLEQVWPWLHFHFSAHTGNGLMEQEMGLSLYFPPGPVACPEDIKSPCNICFLFAQCTECRQLRLSCPRILGTSPSRRVLFEGKDSGSCFFKKHCSNLLVPIVQSRGGSCEPDRRILLIKGICPHSGLCHLALCFWPCGGTCISSSLTPTRQSDRVT